jgi:hypothetical protein
MLVLSYSIHSNNDYVCLIIFGLMYGWVEYSIGDLELYDSYLTAMIYIWQEDFHFDLCIWRMTKSEQ